MEYSEKIKDPRWQRKRLEAMQRDGFKCVDCGHDDKTLAVHHFIYLRGYEPWDYPLQFLTTLCEDCHRKRKPDGNILEEKPFTCPVCHSDCIRMIACNGFELERDINKLSIVFLCESDHCFSIEYETVRGRTSITTKTL
jgi:hypothetical protein